MDWNNEDENEKNKMISIRMKGDEKATLISGKMLRYDQERLKMGFRRSDRDIVVFDISKEFDLNGSCEVDLFHNITPPEAIIMDFRVARDVLVVACSNFEISVIELKNKQVVNVIKTEGIVNSLSLTPDCRYLACSIYLDVNIYEFVDGYEFCILHKKLKNLHDGKIFLANFFF